MYDCLLTEYIYIYICMLNMEDALGYLVQSILHTHHTINFANVK